MDIKDQIARAVFIGAGDAHAGWPSPAHPDCQHTAELVLRALDNAGLVIVPKES